MKHFILDTNVLLYDPQAVFKFEENNIVIPITVIEEIDRFKKDMNETGRNARQISRLLDDLRKEGSLPSSATRVKRPGRNSRRSSSLSSSSPITVIRGETPPVSSTKCRGREHYRLRAARVIEVS